MRAAIALVLPLAVLACSGPQTSETGNDAGASGGAPDGVSFSRDIVPIMMTNCATCHMTGTEQGSISLVPDKAYAQLVNAPSTEVPALKRVVPRMPEQSYLLMKLNGTHLEHGGTGERMPFGAPPLSAEDTGRIEQWIRNGAPNN